MPERRNGEAEGMSRHQEGRQATSAVGEALERAAVKSWFDVGLLLDRIGDQRPWPRARQDADAWVQQHARRPGCLPGAGLDGIDLSGALSPWPEGRTLWTRTLSRGGEDYNALIRSLWQATCRDALELARQIDAQGVTMLAAGTLLARPDALPAALATVIVAETLGLPVLSEPDDGWWRQPQQWNGNRHLGEIQTLRDTLFPWDSPLFVHVVADPAERAQLVAEAGIAPARLVPRRDLPAALATVAAWACGQAPTEVVHEAFAAHRERTRFDDPQFGRIAAVRRRSYLPGLTRLEYMVHLASLIDPNAFRAEEKSRRGRIFSFLAQRMAQAGVTGDDPRGLALQLAAEYAFAWHEGEDELVVDHSLSYRHRHRRHYPHRKLTEQELCGVLGLVCEALLPEPAPRSVEGPGLLVADMPRIDFRPRLRRALGSGRPLAILPDATTTAGLAADLSWIARHLHPDAEVLLCARSGWAAGGARRSELEAALAADPRWQQRLAAGNARILTLPVIARGTHLAQLGDHAAAFARVRDADGFVVAFGHDNLLLLDCLALESFRIGRCDDALQAAFMDLAVGEHWCLWVPPALRPSLAYPTPVQTPRSFAEALASDAFRKACDRLGEAQVLARLAEDADHYGTPVAEQLDAMLTDGGPRTDGGPLRATRLTGLHDNGEPWSGACAELSLDSGWHFDTVFARGRHDTVLDLVAQYRERTGIDAPLAFNGGFILNPELVGKLGLPEDWIGTPLGLLIDDGRIRALPLWNKPALCVERDGKVSIREANLLDGLAVTAEGGDPVQLPAAARNPDTPGDGPAWYDLMCERKAAALSGRVGFRIAADRIASEHRDLETLPLLPVGLTVTFPRDAVPAGWRPGARLAFRLPGWDGVRSAIEAGPMLVRDGAVSIEMARGGWTTRSSIRTQAARIDYTHMRGPKIGVGIGDGRLIVVAINGRIRESVGATHGELASILLEMGAHTAMGFDPGGSVTLVVHGRQLNISPYNAGWPDHPLSLPPQPRFVGNAVLAHPPASAALS